MERLKNRSHREPHRLRHYWRFVFAAAVTMSALASAPAAAAPTKPTAPDKVTVGAVSGSTIQVSWKDVSTNEYGFEITDGQTTKTADADATTYRWGGLKYNQRACFTVRSVNQAGASAWVPSKEDVRLCARTSPPEEEEENFLAFPLFSRLRVKMGGYGLHADQYRSIPGYTMKDRTSNYALDFVPLTGNYGVFSMEDGTVKIVWPDCDAVVVDGGDDIWILYMHVKADPDLQVGQLVEPGTRLGTMVKTTRCDQKTPVKHVHVTLLAPTGPKTAKYIPFVGQSLCGHEVVRKPGSGADGMGFNMLLDGLTESTSGPYTVPACWRG
jgi:hypothetical protein